MNDKEQEDMTPDTPVKPEDWKVVPPGEDPNEVLLSDEEAETSEDDTAKPKKEYENEQ